MERDRESLDFCGGAAYIDLDAIKSNFDALKSLLPSGTKAAAVIKADAYGHGAVETARALSDRADYFAVSVIDEALELRAAGIKTPVMLLSYAAPRRFAAAINNRVALTVYRFEDAEALSETAVRLGKEAVIHIAVDTGMNRIGFRPSAESLDTIKRLAALPNITVEGIFSHFSTADSGDKTYALEQKKKFDGFITALEKEGVRIPIKHICNSAGIIDFDFSYDMVRMGVALYGLYPSEEVDRGKIPLIPAMKVVGRVICVKDVGAGEPIGYGRSYITPEKQKIATVAVGYADGFKRAFSNKGYVLIKGKKAPVRGKVCMDQTMVDVTDIDGVKVGDEAVIMGESGGERITAELLGELCGGFNYEIICTFTPRIKRIYLENGKII